MDNFTNSHNNVIDTDFIEVNTEEKLENMNINKEPLYYTRVQVAKILDEKESTISYWVKEFQSLLNIKIINMTKKYTKTNIENLMFIQKLLRQDHLTIEQVKSYCSEKGFNTEEGLVDGSNPLAIQTFISAMTVEMDKKIETMQNTIIRQQQEMIENLQNIIIENNKILKQEISISVDEAVSERNEELKQDINTNVDNIVKKEIKQLKEDIKYISQDEIKRYTEEQNQHQRFLSNITKIFGKKK